MTVDTTGPAATGAPAAAAGGRILGVLLRNPLTVGSLAVLTIVVVVAALQPWIMPFPPDLVQLRLTNAPPFTTEYILGGDKYGRDILSRLIASTRGALQAAAVLSVVAFAVGTSAGLIAGYFGKLFDTISVGVFSVLMAIPGIIILISLYTLLGTSTLVAMAVFGLMLSPTLFWMVRTLTRGVRNELYVDAARVSGLSTSRIIGRHVLIAIRAPVVLMTASLAGAGIAVQAGLEFLGLGDPGQPSWGAMMTDAFTNFYIAPEQLIWPAAALGLVTGAFSLFSIGLRDSLEGTYVKPSKRQHRAWVVEAVAQLDEMATAASDARLQSSSDATVAPLLAIDRLQIAYPSSRSLTTVVKAASLEVREGEIVGLVGGSGSGKTQVVFATLGLLPEEAIVVRGSIRFNGRELLGLREKDLRNLRGTEMAYIPQEPAANLDPSFTIGAQMTYAVRAHAEVSKKAAREQILGVLDRVGIRDSLRVFDAYPHEISGGMAQRVLIAGAVLSKPRLLVADEPTTALDVTTQAEVLDLLRDLQEENGMGVLIVTHNFGVVADLCNRVVVMHEGEVLEEGTVERVFREPSHEYTRRLLDSILDNAPPRLRLGEKRDGVDA